MTLRSETAIEYFFDNAYLSYCKDHDTLIVCNNHEDRIVLSGVEQGDVDRFIETYMEYVLKDEDLASTFKAAVKKQLAKDVEKIDG